MKIAFISRHEPTEAQAELVDVFDGQLVAVGDVDGFDAAAVAALVNKCRMDGIAAFAVVNAAVALNVAAAMEDVSEAADVFVFRNTARPVVGGKPEFVTDAVHRWTVGGGAWHCGVTTAADVAAKAERLAEWNRHCDRGGE